MKHSIQLLRKSIVSSMLCLMIFLLIDGAGESQAQVTINENGGFEASEVTAGDDTSAVESWEFDVGDYAKVQITDSLFIEGSRALKISVDSVGENAYDVQVVNGNFDLEPGVEYDYRIWARSNESGATAHFTVGNPDFAEMFRLDSGIELNEAWQQIAGSFTPPAGDSVGRAPIHIGLDDNVGKELYFDGLAITKDHTNDNGSFEASTVTTGGDTSDVRGWDLSLGEGADGTFEIVDDPVLDGNRALAVTINALGSNAWDIEAAASAFEMIPGETYRHSVWARASENNATATLTVGGFEEDGFPEYLRFDQSEELTTEWQEFSTSFTMGDDSVAARAPIHFNYDENVGKTIYIDSLRITQVSGTEEEMRKSPVIVEAESGEVGNEWEELTEEDISFISITTDFDETSGTADYPGENRTASYEVTFPAGVDYDLFAKVRVGEDGFDDDSWFTPHGFGEKDPADAEDWNIVNGMQEAGYSDDSDVVRDAGGLAAGVWKWVNLSKNGFQSEPSDTFSVTEAELTQTFQIGAREDGFDIDKIAFGRSDLYYTVENLENGEPGTETDPNEEPEPQAPIAEGKDKWLGNIYSPSQIDGFTNYWNQVTPENAGKWGSVEGTRDEMNWTGLEAAYDLAKDNDYPFRFHVLVWGNQQPTWMTELSEEEQLGEIEEWFKAVAERYPDIDYLEVVNEPLHDPPTVQGDDTSSGGYYEALGGAGETGWDWVIKAFQMARNIFPEDTKLMINDYGIVGNSNATNNYIEIIELLQEEDLIDGIGVQAHAFSTGGSASQLKATLDMLGETGLPIQATEMDIDGNPTEDDELTEEESDQNQFNKYQRVFPVFWEHPSVEGVTLWGWRPGLWRNSQEAYLVRNNGEERPALEWLRAYVDTADVAVSNEPIAGENPREFQLYENYPNPFNPATQIKYDIAATSEVKITVFDVLGRQVQTLVNTQQTPGTYTVTFDASSLSSGVYFYRIQTDSFADVKQMMLVK